MRVLRGGDYVEIHIRSKVIQPRDAETTIIVPWRSGFFVSLYQFRGVVGLSDTAELLLKQFDSFFK
jgi:hypothetical protein